MELAIANKLLKDRSKRERTMQQREKALDLADADLNIPYTIKGINAREEGMKEFLFTLGCYEGEKITVISVLAQNIVIHVKDARYSIDEDLARAILI
jgi:Fe2+ transport system protein FeoA